eukprot:10237232-Lingulodinium_polyedra.AAC.1
MVQSNASGQYLWARAVGSGHVGSSHFVQSILVQAVLARTFWAKVWLKFGFAIVRLFLRCRAPAQAVA